MAFTIARSARPAKPELPDEPQRKLPKLSSLAIQAGPRPQAPKRLPMTADVEVCIYKVTDDAATLWEDVKETGFSLYQIQPRHDAYNSITVNLHDRFNGFLKLQDDAPDNLAELQRLALIKLVTATEDPDDVGFIRWRNAFYVAGDAKALIQCIFLLDDFWFHVSGEMGKDVNVSLHPHIGVNIDECWDFLLYEYTLHEPAQTLRSRFHCPV